MAARKTPVVKKAPAKRVMRRKALRGAALKNYAHVVLERLLERYPDAHCALDFTNAYELLSATILSAQCTDKRVNMVTPALFKRYPDPQSLAEADQPDVEDIIRTTGFFRNKARSLIGMANGLVQTHGGEVPAAMDALVDLPGVGRKTANVILGNAFGRNDGIVVDTHVTRVSNRLGLASGTDAVKIEQMLMPLFPQERWTIISHLFIEHGRQVCIARAPRCGECMLCDICPSSLV
ncbi:MAG: endonuclease III [Gemmatimonadota bacterium]|nr:endonuclease III [Gemmatimonadota bacterium]